MRIALDALGGDAAPEAVVDGALLALSRDECPGLILVGPEESLRKQIEARAPAELAGQIETKLSYRDAQSVVGMHEPPTAVRKLPDATIVRCVDLVKHGEAQAVVTAGNTGAAVAATTLGLRKLTGIRRPGIAATMPCGKQLCTIMDVGANIKCRPVHLFQFGVMASHYHRLVHGVENPRVGLLNIGEEEQKGNELVRETKDLFHRSEVNFVGNIEGQDVFNGRCDVVVCEGFVGNVLLKVSEGLAGSIISFLHEAVGSALESEAEETAWRTALDLLQKRSDFAEYGGALLLGVDGICVICHGRSGDRALANAVLLAARFIETGVNQGIVEGLQELEVEG